MDNGLFEYLAKHYVLEFTNRKVVKLLKVNPIEEKDVLHCLDMQNFTKQQSSTINNTS